MDKILKVHDYLDSLPEVGKVLSFGSIKSSGRSNNKELQSLEIAVYLAKYLMKLKEIVTPYISVEKDEARISENKRFFERSSA